MAVELDRAPGRREVRAELAHGVRRQQAARVLQVEAVDVAAVRERRDPLCVVRMRMHRADRVGQSDDDLLDTLLAGDPGGAPEGRRVVGGLRELEAADSVAHDAPEGEPHDVLVAWLPRDEAHAGRDEVEERGRRGGAHQPNQLPRVLSVEADRDGHVRARREVERMEADPLHHGSDCERLAAGKPGRAPEALVPVARGRVDDLDRAAVRRHAGSTRNSGWPYSTGLAFST